MAETSEFAEEQTSETFDIAPFIDVWRRRRMYLLVPAFFVWFAVWGASWLLPPKYKSSTTILVQEPTVPSAYVASNVGEDLQDQLQNIEERILSAPRLLTIIDKFHLYGNQAPGAVDAKVDAMREDIDVEPVESANQRQITGFTVSYSAPGPRLAQQVTSELTDLFIDENQRAREQESEDTTRFLQNQLQSAGANLAQREAAIQAFDAQHQGELPSQDASNIQILSGLQQQLQSEEDALNGARQQNIYLQTLIQQYETLSDSGGGSGTPGSLPAIDQQLEQLKSKLAALSAEYTDAYPDVRDLKAQIATTEKLRDSLLASLRKKSNTGAAGKNSSPAGGTLNASESASFLQLQSQLQANKVAIADHEGAVASLKARIDQYQSRLNNEPISEEQLADLSRGYEQSQANYDDLLKKENASEMATDMVQMQQGERFTMLDPPSLPPKPDSPNHVKFCGIGVAAGLAFGLVLVGGMEVVDDRMYQEKEIETLLPVTVLAEIPEVVIPADLRKRRKSTMFGWTAATLAIVVVAAAFAVSILHG